MNLENFSFRKDDSGIVRNARLTDRSQVEKDRKSRSASKIAEKAIATLFKLDDFYRSGDDGRSQLDFGLEKTVQNLNLIEYKQVYAGIPLKDRGISVLINYESGAVEGATNNYDYDFEKVANDVSKLGSHAKSINDDLIAKVINLEGNVKRVRKVADEFGIKGDPKIEINMVQPFIYQYDSEHRQHDHNTGDWKDQSLAARLLHLSLPKVGKGIVDGEYYGVNWVSFTGTVGKLELSFVAMIEPETNSVLNIQPLVDMQSGYIYPADPVTETGDPSIHPSDPRAVLNESRDPRNFPLIPATGSSLRGDYIEIANVFPPNVAAPSVGTGAWDFNADTDDFSAVNAYYHCDMVFRMINDMGFNVPSYFGTTVFPVQVDHRGCCSCVNAAAWGTAGSSGLARMTYGLVQAGQPVGIATDVRIVFHEFGHAICYGNVSSPNYGFSHSSGDSMAAIYADPCSEAPDRFMTFPWLTLSNPGILRRHDRALNQGWAWRGTNDDGGYGSEQILATTLFRFYRSLGGDHSKLCEREFASRLALFLNFRGTGLLTPGTNPSTPEGYCDSLIMADLTSPGFEGLPGGLVHKMIRWAFEKQGAFPVSGGVNWNEGLPPVVDTYINDGRKGEYEFTTDICLSKSIYNRVKLDGGGEHQPPLAGQENYLYVIIENRGTQTSDTGKVSAFQLADKSEICCAGDCADLEWNKDFKKAKTATLGHQAILSEGYEIVGPFRWIPKENDCVLISVDTKDDRTNIFNIPVGVTVPVNHFVPFDNNIAMRVMCNEAKV